MGRDTQEQWVTYWSIFGVFIFVDEFTWVILDFIPLYHLFKVCLLLWLAEFEGANTIYSALIKPLLKRYKRQVEQIAKLLQEVSESSNMSPQSHMHVKMESDKYIQGLIDDNKME